MCPAPTSTNVGNAGRFDRFVRMIHLDGSRHEALYR
jgi:hypothetical protein